MSGLYALGVIVLWIVLNLGLWKAWRRIRLGAENNRRRADTVFAVLALAWLSISFWYGGGRKFYYDAEVRRLCTIDGGVKVYETVNLPADSFNQWGQVNFYRPDQGESALGSKYLFRSEEKFYRTGNPTLVRYHHEVIRRIDNQKLGETTSYGRGGGDISGPWVQSNFHCPPTSESSEIALFKKIFLQLDKG